MFKQKEYQIFETGFVQKFDLFFTKIRMAIDTIIFDKLLRLFANIDRNWIINSLFLVGFIYLNWRFGEWIWLLYFAILVFISDSLCSYLFKKNIKRYRPGAWFFGESHPMKAGFEHRLGLKERARFDKFKGYVRNSHASMCSSHAANYFSFALLAADLYMINSLLFFVPFLLVGVGRWYTGAHWLSDIIIGWAVGFIAYIIMTRIIMSFL